MIHIGIDPGKSGGIAAINGSGEIIQLIATARETPADLVAKLRWTTIDGGECVARIEKVGASPQMGVVSAFTFGRSFGWLLGILDCLSIRYEFVTPQRWQKAMGCLSGGDKNVTKAAAQRLWPQQAKRITHALADALLIAEYSRRVDR